MDKANEEVKEEQTKIAHEQIEAHEIVKKMQQVKLDQKTLLENSYEENNLKDQDDEEDFTLILEAGFTYNKLDVSCSGHILFHSEAC